MGEISDMIVNGECCQICCSNFETPGRGYPFTCEECKGEDKEAETDDEHEAQS